jgi:hypothetical protein
MMINITANTAINISRVQFAVGNCAALHDIQRNNVNMCYTFSFHSFGWTGVSASRSINATFMQKSHVFKHFLSNSLAKIL